MTESFMKLRGRGTLGNRFGDQRRTPSKESQGGGAPRSRIPDGKFDSWWPTEKAIWINISPHQGYRQHVYDRELREVVETETTWFEYYSHWVPARQRKFICSCGVHRNKPCYGCARRQYHWDRMDAVEAEKGFRPKDLPDVGRAVNFGLGITIMEEIYTIPKQNKDGTPHRTKAGKPIYKHIAAPLAELEEGSGVNYPTQFGHRAHWSLGLGQRDQLLAWDDTLRGRCGHCASHLFAIARVCPDCEAVVKEAKPIKGVDLSEYRAKEFRCKACTYQGAWSVQYACPDCGSAAEGGLTQFDLRIRKVKMTDKSVLELLEIRVPSSDEAVQKLIMTPLHLEEIFTPDSLEIQKMILGDKATGIDPAHGAFSTNYTPESETEDDQIPF
jgi:hypothetical protein